MKILYVKYPYHLDHIDLAKILDKINEKGFGSLTDREKSLLEKAKSLFKTKP